MVQWLAAGLVGAGWGVASDIFSHWGQSGWAMAGGIFSGAVSGFIAGSLSCLCADPEMFKMLYDGMFGFIGGFFDGLIDQLIKSQRCHTKFDFSDVVHSALGGFASGAIGGKLKDMIIPKLEGSMLNTSTGGMEGESNFAEQLSNLFEKAVDGMEALASNLTTLIVQAIDN